MVMKERIVRRKEGKSSTSVQCAYNAITVGSGRHAEPYILAFHYRSDNVAGRPLGTLFGFFEVEVHDEDAAYIVNFLASVAKKEYFTNPRREISDGFETTLHKVNVALAEIAKEGNVSWLGHLHGVIAAISDNDLHFSATGDGVLALVRENTLRPISDGLADTTSEPHPLKTFTEVSSGKLLDGDVLLALSPAVWTLFTPDDLKKNLARLGQKGFEQFLHTALINELPIAGAVVVAVTAAPLPAPTTKKAPPEAKEETNSETGLLNVWSGQAFEKARAARLRSLSPPKTPPVEERKEDYTDKKTGHIYIQGQEETPLHESPWQTKVTLWSHAFSQNWQGQKESLRRLSRRSRKQLTFLFKESEQRLASMQRRSMRHARSWWRRIHETKETSQAPVQAPIRPVSFPEPITSNDPPYPYTERVSTVPVASTPSATHRLRSGIATIKFALLRFASWLKRGGQSLWQRGASWWDKQSLLTRRWITGGGALVFVTILGIWFYSDRSSLWNTPNESDTTLPAETAVLVPDAAPVLGQDEPGSILLAAPTQRASVSGESIALGSVNDAIFDIRRDRLTNLTTSQTVTLPEPMRLATAMDDLDALFLLSETNTLYIYTITNQKFEKNLLPLPSGSQIDALGSYLTYLYVLDRRAGTVYRFPRAEGGFGEPVQWSKETLSLLPTSPLSVYENIAVILPNGEPTLYSRGRRTSAQFNGTKAPLEVLGLTTQPDTGDIFGLDPKEKRIVRWRADGTLLHQYFHSDLSDATTLIVTKNGEVFIDRPSGTYSFSLPQ